MPDFESDQQASGDNEELSGAGVCMETPKIILCLVEETVHNTTLFAQRLHEQDDSAGSSESGKSSKQVDEVRIGLLTHDIHTGETLFGEYQDGKRGSFEVSCVFSSENSLSVVGFGLLMQMQAGNSCERHWSLFNRSRLCCQWVG